MPDEVYAASLSVEGNGDSNGKIAADLGGVAENSASLGLNAADKLKDTARGVMDGASGSMSLKAGGGNSGKNDANHQANLDLNAKNNLDVNHEGNLEADHKGNGGIQMGADLVIFLIVMCSVDFVVRRE